METQSVFLYMQNTEDQLMLRSCGNVSIILACWEIIIASMYIDAHKSKGNICESKTMNIILQVVLEMFLLN